MSYSPLEQFEPVSFFSIFLGNVNLSITNITFMFIFIMIIFPFLLNGYFLYFSNVNNNLKINVNNSNNISLSSGKPLMVEKINIEDVASGSNDSVRFLNQLFFKIKNYNSYITYKSNTLHLMGFVNNYKNLFFRVFFQTLRNKEISLSGVKSNFSVNFIGSLVTSLKSNKSLSLLNFLESSKNNTNLERLFIPTSFFFLFETIYKFILDTMKVNIGGDSKKTVQFFPIVFLVFVFILICNILGLIPYSSTITSYIIITLALSMMINIGVTIYGFRTHGVHFFSFFLPPGCMFALMPIIIPVELISYVFRVVSLSVRLFANMMAGHTLLAVLAGFG